MSYHPSVTWKSHCVANGAVALALTCRLEVALAAMATAALPDQIEAAVPLGRHRGATHWVLLWLVILVAVPAALQRELIRWMAGWPWHHWRGIHELSFGAGTAMFGLTLGPLLHVLLDGCSSDGVPVAPFSRTRLKLSLYRTRSRRWPWDISELVFLAVVLAVCAFSWRVRG